MPYLPIRASLPAGRAVEVDTIRESEWEEMMELLNQIIDAGLAWPFDQRLRQL